MKAIFKDLEPVSRPNKQEYYNAMMQVLVNNNGCHSTVVMMTFIPTVISFSTKSLRACTKVKRFFFR